MSTLSVIIPTVTGREIYLERLLDFLGDTPGLEIIVIANRPNCGEAWQLGIEQASGEFATCLADDLCPRIHTWHTLAMEAWDKGWCPVPRIWTMPSGEIESAGVWRQHFPHGTIVPMSTVPFCRTDFWKGRHIMPQVHYESDHVFSNWCKDEGRKCRVVEGFDFNHYWASEKRHPAP